MKKIERFYYQPDIINHLISWSWTLLILVIGIIFWLEVTTFNWITATFFALFIIVVFIQIISRTIEVIGTDLIINRVMKSDFSILNINQISDVTKKKHSLSFQYDHKRYKIMMKHKSVDRLYDILIKG